jgi:hypothetical protein
MNAENKVLGAMTAKVDPVEALGKKMKVKLKGISLVGEMAAQLSQAESLAAETGGEVASADAVVSDFLGDDFYDKDRKIQKQSQGFSLL